MLQLRGEAHAAEGEWDKARREFADAAKLWRRSGDGMHEQAALLELERVRKNIEAQHVDAGRLIVFHAAPLVESVPQPHQNVEAGTDETARNVLQPIAFSRLYISWTVTL